MIAQREGGGIKKNSYIISTSAFFIIFFFFNYIVIEDLTIHWNVIIAVDEPESLFGGFCSFGGALARTAATFLRYRRSGRISDIIA